MESGLLLWLVVLFPLVCMGICQIVKSPEAVLRFIPIGVGIHAGLCSLAAGRVFADGRALFACNGWLHVDMLSAYHMIVMSLVFVMSSLYGRHYFDEEIQSGGFAKSTARRYGALWFASLGAMSLVLVSNNVGMMWVGMEATTLVTAFLICINEKKAAIEAMWKYLIICSVGIAFAFLGTILVAAATSGIQGEMAHTIFWTSLGKAAGSLNPTLIKAGFIFSLVGYGTKAGLVPMHTWLPDAHSQSPSPVSAIFSGFMLNTALYCIMRHQALVNQVLNSGGFTSDLALFFGGVSIIVAAAFILFQNDLKRMFAYHSIEHLGIIICGLGLGQLGVFAALFHTLNHSICKSLAFFSAGSIGKSYKTYDMQRIRGAIHVMPFWGIGLAGSLMGLVGAAPMAIFMSELLIIKSAIAAHAVLALVVFLLGTGIIFIAALRHVIPMVWGRPPADMAEAVDINFPDVLVLVVSFALLLILGLWMPEGMHRVLDTAAAIVGGAR